ncbi:EAL domain-containing protein [Xanthobacter dioxanivorans]|uniref:EAL domain-containing protein n=1 Tax=Xanthobacter dioxanivorans TaxID=2528964 RepID=A0A974PSB3_9HYPH|nr:EAL domain-containing protein [Xanthobacter dioxanivorans]QRG08225.1 EAL domain-containing protein [Xanthobacter dioxanivorans]
MFILITALVAFIAGQLHARAVAQSGAVVARMADLFTRYADDTFAAVGAFQGALIGEIVGAHLTADAFASAARGLEGGHLERMAAAVPTVAGLIIVDGAGHLLVATRAGEAAAGVIAAVPFADLRPGRPFLTAPIRTASDGRVVFGLVRAVFGAEGGLIGASIVVMDESATETLLARFALRDGDAVALATADGTVLARFPHVDGVVGRRVPREWNLLQVEGYAHAPGLVDAADRLVALRRLPTVPAVAVVSTGLDNTPWWSQAWLILAGAALLVLSSLALVVLSARHARSLRNLREAREAGRLAEGHLALARAHQRLEDQRELVQLRFEIAIQAMPQGLCCYDAEGRLVVFNARYAELYRIPPEQLRPGMTLAEVVALREEAGVAPNMPATEYLAWRERITKGEPSPPETAVNLVDGRTFVIKHQNLPGGGWVATHEDVTDQRRIATLLSRMALNDELTSLPNRVLFRKRLEQAAVEGGNGTTFAVLLLDLDHFKTINDTLGHSAGDRLLQQVGLKLRDTIATGDVIARIGGDEFGILQCGGTQPAAAIALAQRLIGVLDVPFHVDGQQVVVGVTIGIALLPHDGREPDDVLKCADLALYRTKEEGRGHYRLFEPEMKVAMQHRRTLEVELRRAAVAGEFEIFYQPVVSVPEREVVGHEALLRWRHPERGLVAPDRFIPLAEEIGVIEPISEWVLAQACTAAARHPGEGRIAVNLSAVQFTSRRSDLVKVVASALGASGLSPERLELEITETTLLRDTEGVLATLHALKALGVSIAMDDFGTGYSSLDYLRRFPFDRVKVDRSFIHKLARDNPPVLRALTDLCRAFSMHVTAEGVETEEQFAAIVASGYTEAQGFLFGRPAPREGNAPLRSGRL